ncbi:hypothetical protein CYMTET_27213, partial [Cymbomonas tetramitiformis]
DAFLIDGSIAENICYGTVDQQKEMDEALVKDVMDAAACDWRGCMWGGDHGEQEAAHVTEFAPSREAVLQGRVGAGGSQLSGGQRQRVALARALCRKPSVLILDEPTTALDDTSTAHILEAVRSLRDQGVTVLLISHDAKTLKDVDHTISLHDGTIEQVK